MMEDSTTDINVLPKELTDVPFEELFEMRNKLGSKAYSDLLLGERKHKPKFQFHRENKNRPREMSSKIKPSLQHSKNKLPAPEKKAVDPRFSSSCGEFNPVLFEKNYKFIDKIKKKERKMLKKELQNTEIDDDERKKIRSLLQRMENQRIEKVRLKKKEKTAHIDKDYQIHELKEGRKPLYPKKSERKLFDLVKQFEELKEKGGLLKHIKRRRKKLTHKDRKNLFFLDASKEAV